jgi:hypothetical protein
VLVVSLSLFGVDWMLYWMLIERKLTALTDQPLLDSLFEQQPQEKEHTQLTKRIERREKEMGDNNDFEYERRSDEEESSSEEGGVTSPLPPKPKPKIDYSKNPEKDPDVQELLKEGWVMAPKGAKVQVKSNVPSIFSQKPDVSYLWKNQEPEQEPQYPTQPEQDPFQIDLSKHKITASFEIGPELAR